MKRFLAVLTLLAVMMVPATLFAGQRVEGRFSDTPMIWVNSSVVADKDACGRPYNPYIKVLDEFPTAGSFSNVRLQVCGLPWGADAYLYVFVNDELRGWTVCQNGYIFTVYAPLNTGWQVGTYFIKVVISSGPRWNLTTYGPRPATELGGSYIAPECCEAVEVEQIMFSVTAPPPPCDCPCNCNCCNCCFNPLSFFFGILLGAAGCCP